MFDNNLIAEEDNGLGDYGMEPEVVAEAAAEVVPEVVPDPAEVKTEWLTEFNSTFKTSYGSVDELKTIFDIPTPPEENNAPNAEFEALKQKHEFLINEYRKKDNPLEYFSNEVELKKNLLMKSNPKISGAVAERLFDIDTEKGNPLDIIALDLMLNNKAIKSEEAAKSWFKANHGIDEDSFEDMTEIQRMTIDIEAEKAAKNIMSIREGVVVPTTKSVDEILAEATFGVQPEYDIKVWDGKLDSLVKSISEIKIEDGEFSYSELIDDEFKAGLSDVIKETIIKGKINPTPENIAALRKEAEDIYFLENKASILRRAVNQAQVKMKEEIHKSIHNDADPDKVTVIPPSSSGKTTNLLKNWGIPD
jgi:hypothetical protein